MKIRRLLAQEIRLGVEWLWRMSAFLAIWVFRIFLRLVPLAVLVFLLGRGCLHLKSHVEAGNKPPQETPSFEAQRQVPGDAVRSESHPYRAGNENLEAEIHARQSQLRSWDYTVRSLKRDIERLFRKK